MSISIHCLRYSGRLYRFTKRDASVSGRLLLLLLFFFSAHAQQGTRQEKFDKAGAATVQAGYNDNVTDNVSTYVKNNIDRVRQILSVKAPIHFSNTVNTISLPATGVVFNRPYLSNIQRKFDKDVAGFIIAFIMAHEMAHQLQFAHYGASDVISTSCEMRGVYEAQADIMAGYAIGQLYNIQYNEAINGNTSKLVFDAMEFVYDIGEEEFSLSTHPSRLRRRNAFRNGLAFSIAQIGTGNGQFNKALNWNGTEALTDWSLRTAKGINHYPNAVALAISYLEGSEENWEWDTNPNHPNLKYHYVLQNNSDRPIKINLTLRLQGHKRSNYVEYFDPRTIPLEGQTRNHSFTIAANDKYTLTGSLDWTSVAHGDKMPHFVSMEDEESMVSAEYADNTAGDNGENCFDDNLALQTNAKFDNDFLNVLEQANLSSLGKFEDLKTGFGKKSDYSLDYVSSLKIPYSATTQISIDDDDKKAELEATFDALGMEPDEIAALYAKLKNLLQKYPGFQANEKITYGNDKRHGKTTSKSITFKMNNSGTTVTVNYGVQNDHFMDTLSLTMTPQ